MEERKSKEPFVYTIHKWPDSQICQECKYGIFVQSPLEDNFLGPVAFICAVNCKMLEGGGCEQYPNARDEEDSGSEA